MFATHLFREKFNILFSTSKIYLHDSELSKKILACLFPILPKLTSSINKVLFDTDEFNFWPEIDTNLLIENKIKLPIQIKGKLVTTIDTLKGYSEKDILNYIYKLDKIKSKINDKNVIRVINVQDKIINIITN